MARKELVFNEDGTLDEKANKIVTDDEGYQGCWCTDKRKGKYFIRLGETAEDAWKRRKEYLLSQPSKKSKAELILVEKDGFIMSYAESKVLESAVFQKVHNRNYTYKTYDFAYTADHFYVLKMSGGGYNLIEQYDLMNESEDIERCIKLYEERL